MTARGMGINGRDIDVRHVGRNVLTVSFFGVPVYMTNDMLTDKLTDFNAKQMSPWTRKTYNDLLAVESGIVHCRVELPQEVTSLPYACRIADTNIVIKQNGQHKVCNICLSSEHLMRSCSQRRPPGRCFSCGLLGHYVRDCPDQMTEEEYSKHSGSYNDEYDDNNDDDVSDEGSDNSNEGEDGSDDMDDYRSFLTKDDVTKDGGTKNDVDIQGTGELFIDETQEHETSTTDKKRRRVTTMENDTEDKDYDPNWTSPHRTHRRSQRRRVLTMTMTRDGPVELKNKYQVLLQDSGCFF